MSFSLKGNERRHISFGYPYKNYYDRMTRRMIKENHRNGAKKSDTQNIVKVSQNHFKIATSEFGFLKKL